MLVRMRAPAEIGKGNLLHRYVDLGESDIVCTNDSTGATCWQADTKTKEKGLSLDGGWMRYIYTTDQQTEKGKRDRISKQHALHTPKCVS